MTAIPNDLMCPISLDWLEDPITLPCCGRAVSRESIQSIQSLLDFNNLSSSLLCPICRSDLSNFDVNGAVKSINIAYMVEQARNKYQTSETEIKKEMKPKWSAKICSILNNNSVNQTVIGRLEIVNKSTSLSNNTASCYKTLLVPVIDKSGSMSGNPIEQVKYSLNRILDITYDNQHIITSMVTYDDNGKIIEVNKSMSKKLYKDIINKIVANCGTSFRSAFDQILNICKNIKRDDNISTIAIIFLTDGEDSSVIKSKRVELVQEFLTSLKNVIVIPYVIHTVGFGANHDYDFLNNLRQIGTYSEGAYRYANPKEDSDSLSNKINSLLDVIVKTSSIPLNIVIHEFENKSCIQLKYLDDNSLIYIPIINKEENDKYWIDLTYLNDRTRSCECAIKIDNDQINIPVEFVELSPFDENMLIDKWYSHLIDDIASEILMVSNSIDVNSLDREIHIELLQQRSRSIQSRLINATPNDERLKKLIESLMTIKSGGNVNKLKLNDMKFEGKYVTNVIKPITNINTNTTVQFNKTLLHWNIIDRSRTKRLNEFNYGNGNNELLTVITQYNNDKAINWINLHCNSIIEMLSYAFIMACAIGRVNLIKKLITRITNLQSIKLNNMNAIDFAILYGYWYTYDILIEYGLKPTIDGQLLLRTCISRNFYNVADRLLNDKIAVITEDMLNCVPTVDGLKWLSSHNQKEINIENAIIKGMIDVIKSKISIIDKIELEPLIIIFEKSTHEHIIIIDMLINNNKININKEIKINDDITWPLFIACEKGNIDMAKLIINHTPSNMINKQNLKGTTSLWIASCNRHIDIVIELLNKGADPNLANFKGDSPLIPCCQKGSESIVELLLEAGAKLSIYNVNRDNPLLICCRTGQSRILELILKRLPENDVKFFLSESAEIDGFTPLIAATELDKTDCIKVLIKYGADIEFKTAENNKIIAGATALHVGCFYGRLNAVKLLCEHGGNIFSRTSNGMTPLHIAIKQGHISVVRYLMSNPNIKDLMRIVDNDGRLPQFYAQILGNEEMYEELFKNKLAKLFEKMLKSNLEIKSKCLNTLINYSRSIGCYEYDNITNIDLGRGMTLLTFAILNNNHDLQSTLMKMNADINKSDDYGITPAFWIAYFNGNFNNIDNVDIIEKIKRVKKVCDKNLQNKILLNFNPNMSLELLESSNSLNSLIKMNDTYFVKINKNALKALINSEHSNYSLLGFMDKSNNNLRNVILDAKIHLIKMIAISNDSDQLEPVHLLSLYLYTGNFEIFKQVNQYLVEWNEKNILNQFIFCLYKAITLIPQYKGECYRAIDLKFSTDMFKINDKITWNMFGVCSKNYTSCIEYINQKKGIIFIIKSQYGRDISKYSRYPADEEIIFLPQSTFIITNFYIANIIALGQENIRKSTYLAKDKDILKATNSEACIIVELTEIKIDSTEMI
jgi:ankyrin repeat protein/uncharacterized protein YegL